MKHKDDLIIETCDCDGLTLTYYTTAEKYEEMKYKDDLITKKEAYEAMLHMLKTYQELTGSKDLTDILSAGEYMIDIEGNSTPADSAMWEYWLEAIEKLKKEGPMYKEFISEE